MYVQIGHAGLRNRDQPLFFSFPAKVFGDQSLGHIVLEAFAKALPGDGGGHVPGAKTRQPRALLIALNLYFSFACDFRGGDLDGNLALDVFLGFLGLGRVGSLCGAHVLPFPHRSIPRPHR